jgi:hypothetical protein
MDPDDSRRFEPWPWILASMLAFMIGASVTFYHVAASHPDPVLDTSPRPGVER